MSKVVIDVKEDFHKALRISAIQNGETMRDFIIRVMSEEIERINPEAFKLIKKDMKEEK